MTKPRLNEIRALAERHAGKGKQCVDMLLECCDEIERLQRPYARRKMAKEPPMLSSVLAYAIVIGLDADEATSCFDYYEKMGWVAGKAKVPIQSWQAALREWKRRCVKEVALSRNRATDPARWDEFLKSQCIPHQPHKFAPEYLRLDFARWLRNARRS